jgi:hypothetical protein
MTKIHKTKILPVVLSGSETLYTTLREDHRLRGFENMALGRMIGTVRDEVRGDW